MGDRRRHIEGELGASLPSEYWEFLQSHSAKDEAALCVDGISGTYDVRQFFELGSGEKSSQLDEVYRLVGDVLPLGTLPIAEDWAGNFFLLKVKEPKVGSVSWWDHERDVGDNSVKPVASSFGRFIQSIRREQ